jgi:hypothetical protein
MNSQNILKYYGTRFDVKLDSSEFYDYEISKVQGDYATDILDFTHPITYTGLTISDSLAGFSCDRNTITLVEYDNRINDSSYIYSGLTSTLDYGDFVNYLGYPYEFTILNNDIYSYTGITGENHYFRITGFNNILDLNLELTGFTSDITNCIQKLANPNNCCPITPKLLNKPWAYKFDTGAGIDNCDPIIRRRTEKGWTLDFIFNRESLPWSLGGVFYYLGVRGDDNVRNYADNNLSFQFTPDRRIKWVSVHYTGYCTDAGVYTEDFYVASGQTPTLCTTLPTKDFNITIAFERNKYYEKCEIENDGGWNDLIPEYIISEYTNMEVTAVTSTQIAVHNDSELLNKKWAEERQRRLGTLKIYLNGRPIYKLKNWEEIIPSERGNQPFIQSWGGGTGLMNDLHYGVCCFNMKSIKYYEEPLDFLHVRHNFLTRLNQYDFFICGLDCEDDITGFVPTPTPTPTPTPAPNNIVIDANFSPGSVVILYTATSDNPVLTDTTVTFDNVIELYDGTSILIRVSITILLGETVGTYQKTLRLTYNDVNQNICEFTNYVSSDNVSINPPQLNTYVFENVIPEEDVIYDAIITDDDLIYHDNHFYISAGDNVYIRFVDPPTP